MFKKDNDIDIYMVSLSTGKFLKSLIPLSFSSKRDDGMVFDSFLYFYLAQLFIRFYHKIKTRRSLKIKMETHMKAKVKVEHK